MKYKRVILKVTGEALKADGRIFDPNALAFLVREIGSVYRKVDLALVVGGGNIIRGKTLAKEFGTTPATADFMGMAATIINAMLVQDALERQGMETRIMTSVIANQLAEPYLIRRALRHLEKGRIVILAGGTGNAGVTTDTGSVLRAGDLQAELLLKGTKVDGVYDKDPVEHPDAKLFERISYAEFLDRGLGGILDRTAVAQAEMRRLPIFVFPLFKEGNLARALDGKARGSMIA